MPKRSLPIMVSYEYPGSELTDDAWEFVRAMEAYQRRYKRRYPQWSEVLYVLRTLGYAKCVPGAAIPEPTTPQNPHEEVSCRS